eukprot:GHRR01020820.1.p1 GENE.GHRR01020820.1~~GHRR01020820.1.p1  ORF type:complete len:456 (+),score=169.59 GHRR01020820.1:286-1653(+)
MCPTQQQVDIHATGQPDTPVEVLTNLLQEAMQQQTLEQQRQYVKQALDIAAGLDAYLDKVTSPPPKVINDLIKASVNHDWTDVYNQGKTKFLQKKECCAGSLEGRLLKMLVAITGAKQVLEVGMFTGTSTLAMAEALPEDGKVVALDIEPYMAEFAAPFFEASGLAGRIRPVIGPAQATMKHLAQEGASFDLIFLDANKDGYQAYYDTIMEQQLLAAGGLLVVDNSLMKGRVYAPGSLEDSSADAVRAFNENLVADKRVEVVVLPFRDGVSLVRRRCPSQGDEVVRGFKANTVLQRLKLTGKAALITGAGQGIGRAWAHALGEAGAAVAVVDLDNHKAAETVVELLAKGVRATAIQADVSKKADCSRMVSEAVSALGRLDIAINNAGINKNSAAEDTPENEWDATFSVNTKGVFLSCQVGVLWVLGLCCLLPGHIVSPKFLLTCSLVSIGLEATQ